MAQVYNLIQPVRCDCGTGTSVTLRDVDRVYTDHTYAELELCHQLRLDCWGLVGRNVVCPTCLRIAGVEAVAE